MPTPAKVSLLLLLSAACGDLLPQGDRLASDGGTPRRDAPAAFPGFDGPFPRDAAPPLDAYGLYDAHETEIGPTPREPTLDSALSLPPADVSSDAVVDSAPRDGPDATYLTWDAGLPTGDAWTAGFDASAEAAWTNPPSTYAYNAVAVDRSGHVIAGGSTSVPQTSPLVVQLDLDGSIRWQQVPVAMGGSVAGVAVDAADDVVAVGTVVAGATSFGGQETTTGGGFVVEYDVDGHYVFSDVFPGSVALGVAATPEGGWVVVGTLTGSVDFDGESLVAPDGSSAFFVLGLDGAGNTQFVTPIANDGGLKQSASVAVDSSGYIYLAGVFNGTLDAIAPIVGPSPATNTVAGYLLELSANGAILDEMSFPTASTITVTADALGDLFIAGAYDGTVSCGSIDPLGGPTGVFVCKFASQLAPQWGEVFALSSGEGAIESIAADATGGLAVGGSTTGTIDFVGGPVTSTTGGADAFAAKFDPSGNLVASSIATMTFAGLDVAPSSSVYGIAAPASGPQVLVVGENQGPIGFPPSTPRAAGMDSGGFVAWWSL